MNRSDIISRVREITSLDSDDVSDDILSMYVQDGFQRIIALEGNWPFLAEDYSLAVTAGTRSYALSTVGADLREITSLVNTASGGSRLTLVPHHDAEATWLAGNQGYVGVPRFYSVWNAQVHLWPTPDTEYTLSVRGYRSPTAWYNSDSTEVDADPRLHLALVYFVLAKVYELQEDAEMSSFYSRTFSEAVQLAHNDIMRQPVARPLVLSNGLRGYRFSGPTRGPGPNWVLR